jgi:hypothetical protein
MNAEYPVTAKFVNPATSRTATVHANEITLHAAQRTLGFWVNEYTRQGYTLIDAQIVYRCGGTQYVMESSN